MINRGVRTNLRLAIIIPKIPPPYDLGEIVNLSHFQFEMKKSPHSLQVVVNL